MVGNRLEVQANERRAHTYGLVEESSKTGGVKSCSKNQFNCNYNLIEILREIEQIIQYNLPTKWEWV